MCCDRLGQTRFQGLQPPQQLALLRRTQLADGVILEFGPQSFDAVAQRQPGGRRFDEGYPTVAGIRPAAHETGSLNTLYGSRHRRRVGVEHGREVCLPLRSCIPQVHEQQFVSRMQSQSLQ
ncbi:MAG: hypothetical protein JWR34_296 [Mycobacterium sp.]|nr:hypothetical protein [Mycobacterium sp.]